MLLDGSLRDPAKTLDLGDEGGGDPRYRSGDLIEEKYRLIKRLGVGGMGEVWSARSLSLEVDVAIKLIVGNNVDPVRKQRLLQEARVAARVEHPAVIRIFDSGTSGPGDPYIVMELLRGESLAELLARGSALIPERAVAILLPIVRALSAIHAAGVVHRDLKPDNVFLTKVSDGSVQPKLLDFGIAKLESPDAQRLTHTGALMGSPCYMSPEQARGEEADARSDLWACCAMLYRATAGRAPFRGPNVNAVLYAILSEEPARPESMPDDALWSLISRGMQKRARARFASADELADAMSRYLLSQGITEDVSGFSLRTARSTGDGAIRAKRQARDGEGVSSVFFVPQRKASLYENRQVRFAVLGGLGLALLVGGALLGYGRLVEPEPTWLTESHEPVGDAGSRVAPFTSLPAATTGPAAGSQRRSLRGSSSERPSGSKGSRPKLPPRGASTPPPRSGLPQFKDPFQ